MALAAPQMVLDSRMLYTSWMPADPEAAAALLPEGGAEAGGETRLHEPVRRRLRRPDHRIRRVFADLPGPRHGRHVRPVGGIPAASFTLYFNSYEVMRKYTTAEHDVPAVPGSTTSR